MTTVKHVFDFLNELAPVRLRIEDDNVGQLVGRPDAKVKKVVVALDITPEVIDECIGLGAELIVAHHPVIYEKVSSLTDRDFTGARVLRLAENKISAICMHTNLDIAEGGVNDVLAERLGLRDVQTIIDPSLSGGNDRGVCRIGSVEKPMSAEAFARFVKGALGGNGVKLLTAGREVRRVAVGGGACGSDLHLVVAAGCDTFVTADVKHSHLIEAKWYGVNLIDAGHFATEDVICPVLVRRLSDRFPGLQVSKSVSLTDMMMYIGE